MGQGEFGGEVALREVDAQPAAIDGAAGDDASGLDKACSATTQGEVALPQLGGQDGGGACFPEEPDVLVGDDQAAAIAGLLMGGAEGLPGQGRPGTAPPSW